MSLRILVTSLAIVTSVLAGSVQGAATMSRSLTEAASSAESIVDAEIVSVSTDPSPPFPGVWSKVRLHVHERIAGRTVPQSIDLFAPGGRIGDQFRFVVGAPYFRPGERYLLLLRTLEQRVLLGDVRQGAFRLDRSETGEIEVRTPRETLTRAEFVRMLKEARGQLP